MSKGSNLFDKLFKKNKKSIETETDASVEVLDKAGDEDKAEINSKKKNGAFGRIKTKFRIRLKRRNSKKADADNDAASEDTSDGAGKKKNKKAPKVKREKKPRPAKKKKIKSGGDGKKIKPLMLVIIIAGGILAGVAVFLIIMFVRRPTIEQQLLDAQLLLNEKSYTEAEAAYQKIIKRDKTVADAYIGLADAMVGNDDTDGAIQELTQALLPTADDPKIHAKIEALSPKPDDTQAPAEPGTEAIVFKDEAFARLLRQAMGKSPSSPVSEADLADITTLKILGDTHAAVNKNIVATVKNDGYIIEDTTYPDYGVKYDERGKIKSLADVAHFKKLRRLVVAYNSVDDISGIENLSDLHTLGLYFNDIRDISPISKLTTLKYLYIYDNQITDISPLAPLTILEQLWLNKNQIKDITAVKSFSALEELFISDNEVTDISAVSGLSNLCFLYADRNNISDISALKDMQSLTDVSFIGNPVTDLSPVSHVRNINKSYSFNK